MERNKHIFKNDGENADDISGIYRWIDKIYELQIINYGKRFMLEFIVPEPAAFIRYAMSKLPPETDTLVKPDLPGYCLSDGKTFQPLQVEDLTAECYLDWVSKYNVTDVTAPPSTWLTVSHATKITPDEVKDTLGHHLCVKDSFVKIPDGYIPWVANINLRYVGGHEADMYVQIQKEQVGAGDMDTGGWKDVDLDHNPTTSVPYTIDSIAMWHSATIVNILCGRSVEKFREWQFNTFRAIMNAYLVEKSRYDDAIRTTMIRAGYSEIKGKNPLYNRETEKLELKKGCISILTAQRYDAFDAVKKNITSARLSRNCPL